MQRTSKIVFLRKARFGGSLHEKGKTGFGKALWVLRSKKILLGDHQK